MSQGAAQTEELRRRLEAAKAELRRLLDGCRRQQDVERLMEGGCRGPAATGAEGEAVQSQLSERKSPRGEALIPPLTFPRETGFCHLK